MTELDVISLASAKNWLSIDDNDSDADITRLIKTAIAWVETYTCYRLWQRQEVVTAFGETTFLSQYPVAIDSVKNSLGADQTYYTRQYATKLKITTGYTPNFTLEPTYNSQNTITLTVGYDDVTKIPNPLIDACYKLITYLFENRDAYQAALPSDVQILINQYRRALI
jgi:uncharacterized phiE125 gp8 family phage protein